MGAAEGMEEMVGVDVGTIVGETGDRVSPAMMGAGVIGGSVTGHMEGGGVTGLRVGCGRVGLDVGKSGQGRSMTWPKTEYGLQGNRS